MWSRLKVWFYSSRWYLLSGLVALVAFVWLVARRKPQPREPTSEPSVLPEVPVALQERLRQAEEQALVARIEASAKADAQKQELQQILADQDGANRRRRLASMLQGLR